MIAIISAGLFVTAVLSKFTVRKMGILWLSMTLFP